MERDIDQALYERGITTRASRTAQNRERKDRSLTKEEAIVHINVFREMNVPKHSLRYPMMTKWSITSGVEHVYLNGLLDELVERVRTSPYDPITAVAEYYYEMDEVVAMSDIDHHITHFFAGYMERESYEVLMYLKEKEKEMNDKWA